MTKPKGEKPARERGVGKGGAVWEGNVDVPDEGTFLYRVRGGGFLAQVSYFKDGKWHQGSGDDAELVAAHLARLLKAGDQSNEGAQTIRDRTTAAVRRLKGRPAAGSDISPVAYSRGWIAACDAVLRYLSGQAARYVKPGGLRGPGRARRA